MYCYCSLLYTDSYNSYSKQTSKRPYFLRNTSGGDTVVSKHRTTIWKHRNCKWNIVLKVISVYRLHHLWCRAYIFFFDGCMQHPEGHEIVHLSSYWSPWYHFLNPSELGSVSLMRVLRKTYSTQFLGYSDEIWYTIWYSQKYDSERRGVLKGRPYLTIMFWFFIRSNCCNLAFLYFVTVN